MPSAIFLSQMFLSVIPHDWQREFNAWIVNETGWLKQGEHSVGLAHQGWDRVPLCERKALPRSCWGGLLRPWADV
jgi:SRSO17 transposase